MVTHLAFWISALLIIYVYAGYPMLLWAIASVRQSRHRDGVEGEAKGEATTDAEAESGIEAATGIEAQVVGPRVTLLISAYNEADCIVEKLDNTLAIDYPRERFEVIVVSDASEDGTDDIVRGYAGRGVRLLRMAARGGKTLGLNAAVSEARGELIVFSDANALYRPDAVRHLIAHFEDPRVGAVVGESTYLPCDSASGQAESLYWRYETWIKKLESRCGSVVGGDGAIYAVRRSLYEPMPAAALSDFVNPLQVVRRGFRCVYEPRALSYEAAAPDFRHEFRRKVRIVNRAWRAVWLMRAMLNPMSHGAFTLELWSHKVLRWCVPGALLATLALNAALLGRHAIYSATLALQLAFYALAACGFLLSTRREQRALLRIPFYFCLVNVAAGIALLQALSGRSYTTWTTSRAGG